MTTIQKKLEILQSLNRLDAEQSEKVLGFIQSMITGDLPSTRHQNYKRKALKEINQALRVNGGLMS